MGWGYLWRNARGVEERSEEDTKIGTHRDWTLNKRSRKPLRTSYLSYRQALERPVPRAHLSPQHILCEERGKGVYLRTARVLEPALEGIEHREPLSG